MQSAVVLALISAWVLGLPRIHDIQGAAHVSPWVDQEVQQVGGVVTQLVSGGFYMQDPAPDADERTSEAIRVRAPDTVTVGDIVQVSGTVRELRPGCDPCSAGDEAFANLTTTEIFAALVQVVGHADELPEAITIGSTPGARSPPSAVIEDDTVGDVERDEGSFEPAGDGLDFYESLEGMRARVDEARVVGPTRHPSGRSAEVVIVPNRAAAFGPLTSRGGLLRLPADDNPERILVSGGSGARVPDLDVGDTLIGPIVGVIDYAFGNYQLVLSGSFPGIALAPEADAQELVEPLPLELTVATLNVQNLHRRSDATKLERLAAIIAGNLAAPDVVVLQEIQDDSGPVDDGATQAGLSYAALAGAISRRGGPSYSARDVAPSDGQDGGEPGGNIRVGFLLRSDRGVALVERPGAAWYTGNVVHEVDGAPEFGFSPGRIEPANTAFVASRKPLAVELDVHGSKLFLIGVHLNSQIGDLPLFGRFQPPDRPTRRIRTAQASVVARFVRRILEIDANANVLVAGDFNDVPSSPPLETLEDAGLRNLGDLLAPSQRYTNIYQGNSEAIDHLLASRAMAEDLTRVAIVHANVDLAGGKSDHDPVVARFALRPRAPSRTAGCGCVIAEARLADRGLICALLSLTALAARLFARSERRAYRPCGIAASRVRIQPHEASTRAGGHDLSFHLLHRRRRSSQRLGRAQQRKQHSRDRRMQRVQDQKLVRSRLVQGKVPRSRARSNALVQRPQLPAGCRDAGMPRNLRRGAKVCPASQVLPLA